MKKPSNTEEYIAAFPKDTRVLLEQLRLTIKKAAPQAREKISYGMPTLVLNGNLVHFAAHQNHVGFYPAPSGINANKAQLGSYHTSKGAIQFPLDQPLPVDLITKIVKFRVQENLYREK